MAEGWIFTAGLSESSKAEGVAAGRVDTRVGRSADLMQEAGCFCLASDIIGRSDCVGLVIGLQFARFHNQVESVRRNSNIASNSESLLPESG